MQSPEHTVRIAIAGEHPIFREGLRRLLEAQPGFTIVRECGKAGPAAALVREARPDVLLLGFARKDNSLEQTLQEIAAAAPSVRTIILTDIIDCPDLLGALRAGARGIVPKDSPPDVLIKCIQSTMRGHFWIGEERAAEVPPSLRKLEAARRRTKAFGLTRREIDIIRAVVAGETNREIARRWSISENTVKSHLTHIFNKVGASNRVELALFAAHHRLIEGV